MAKIEKAAEKTNVVWRDDPLCHFVFFAVLEGLYRDGVQNEVVDAILAADVKSVDEQVKHCFVFKCELCHAVYEAFALYRARPAFKNTEGGRSTFGTGVDEKILEALTGDSARSRVYAMGSLIRPWIQHRVKETRMTPDEQRAMKKKFEMYVREGGKLLREHRRNDVLYIDWNFYGTCQACEASRDFRIPSSK